MKDIESLNKTSDWSITAEAEDDNIQSFYGIILGPDGSPWEGGIFKLHIQIPDDYPSKPPEVKFLSNMFHPNIYRTGKICLDIL